MSKLETPATFVEVAGPEASRLLRASTSAEISY
jgi:hypothetical protein